ncbi:hypothetical protein O6H91_23G049100 [Diphasiastrum complanatum]|uniref:Uncharacterized protein n=2 Tax=Diphasiastrum complanatum TaxID=34168 RepID=A0ACC2AAM4_DIPCM|nr:hypothetical protein O6H91_23G049100 [Diphasiastrum complanatum]KAJ7514547.1 hypothetical protein O6H91_23G049100 [Diphasiastrum complanatum]
MQLLASLTKCSTLGLIQISTELNINNPLASLFPRSGTARLQLSSNQKEGGTPYKLRCQVTVPTAVPQPHAPSGGAGRSNQFADRKVIRLALPSKGRMAEGTINLLKECQLSVHKPNPRQYTADIPELDNLEVWFQRESDVVRKLLSGDVDLGIVGYDIVAEYGQDDGDLIIIHDALGFGECHLSLGIPTYGIFENVSSVAELAAMPQWTADHPLRIVTGFTYLGNRFLKNKGLKHAQLSTADGALEAAPAMGTADAILDLVSSGTTLKENNLKEIDGGRLISSQAVFVASKRALLERKGVLDIAHEMLERLEAHLRARNQFLVTGNMRGDSPAEIAERILTKTHFPGLQGPTISPVYTSKTGIAKVDYYAVALCIRKNDLYDAVRELRAIGGSGVLVSPLTYIFEEEPRRWRELLQNLEL